MSQKEKADAGKSLHSYKNTSHRTAKPNQEQRYCGQLGEKERFLKTNISMSEIGTPFPTWR